MSLPETQKTVYLTGNSDTFEVIKYGDNPTPVIESPTDIIIKNYYTGVNFIEQYFRKGYYPCEFPYIMGREASGKVVAVGSAVKDYVVGDNVAYLGASCFAEYCKLDEGYPRMVKMNADATDNDFKQYASILISGLTAYTFAEEAYEAKKGDFVLVWAAAGGVGKILTQILSHRGVNVIALASSNEKLQLAKDLGAKFVIDYKNEDVVTKVKEITDGEGVRASYDSVGKATWNTSLSCLGTGGTLVSYGNSSGKVEPISIYSLVNNTKATRPSLYGFVATRKRFNYYFDKIMNDLKSGVLTNSDPQVFDLKDYIKVAQLLESGKTTGKFILKVA